MLRSTLRGLRPLLSAKLQVPRVPRFFTTEDLNKLNTQKHTFKAETQKLLEIVARSLYMDKEVFVRELVSNASDALEKQRFKQVSGETEPDQLGITISTDPDQKTFTIKDNGIGMDEHEMVQNLGTIAYSGSGKFMETLRNQGKEAESIIGQFGVGFYSSFIVADEVRVLSRKGPEEKAYLWVSKGVGDYEISEVENPELERGTEITVSLKEDSAEFASEDRIKKVLRKYSNFVTHPLELNKSQVNVQEAIWSRNRNEVTEQEYQDFFEYVTGQKVPYKYLIHFSTDIPLSMKVLLYIPSTHKEKFGLAQEDYTIDLYSRKVLIKHKCIDLLPQWLRFMKGVVDCEDIPLNISRETYQDSALMERIRGILTRRILKQLQEKASQNEADYNSWYSDFGNFIVEGMALDMQNNREIAPLARYNWSLDSNMVSLSKYIENMAPGQNKIYYLFSANREHALNSPYLEPFIPKNIPVILSHQHIDEMIFRSLGDYQGYKIVNIESSLDSLDKDQLETSEYNSESGIPEDDLVPFTDWVRNELKPGVEKVVVSHRLRDSPAVVVGEMPSAMRQVYQLMEKEKQPFEQVRNQTLEVNPNHDIMVRLNRLRKNNPELAKDVLEQVFDNSLFMVGIAENIVPMVKRTNKLLKRLLEKEETN